MTALRANSLDDMVYADEDGNSRQGDSSKDGGDFRVFEEQSMASAQHCPFVARHHHKEMWHSPPSHFLFWDDAPAREVVLARAQAALAWALAQGH